MRLLTFITQGGRLCRSRTDLDTCYNRKEQQRPLGSTRHAERYCQRGLWREPDVVLHPVKMPSLVGGTRSARCYPHISKMYPTPDEAAVLETVEAFMVKIMAQYDPSHDALHGESKIIKKRIPRPHRYPLSLAPHKVQRVRKTALKLASDPLISSRSPDLLVIELSALLHDVLDKKYVPESLSSNPYAFFLPMFEELDTKHPSVGLLAEDGKRLRFITDVVTNVSWSTEKKLRQEGKWGAWHDGCVELHCVQDADRLDAIGAFGTCAVWSWRDIVNHVCHQE